MSDSFKALHATLEWEPYSDCGIGDGVGREGFRRADGAGFVLPERDGRWWATWAHPMLSGRPGWHHHALGSYADAQLAAMAFDKVYDLERIAGNTDRCPDAIVENAA